MVTESADFNELVEKEPWLSTSKLVVKPDMLFGKPGKSGLVALNLDLAQVASFVIERLGKENVEELKLKRTGIRLRQYLFQQECLLNLKLLLHLLQPFPWRPGEKLRNSSRWFLLYFRTRISLSQKLMTLLLSRTSKNGETLHCRLEGLSPTPREFHSWTRRKD
ncbi:hypothetical protein K1719_041924 [Acacia pycnantha]|nr:hypothetical protein K1719_041924 [Acacia pycnantha]